MKKIWLAAVMAASVVAMQTPAAAGPMVNGIPAQGPHGVHGIIIHRCWHHRCCHRYGHHCGPHGIIIGRVIGRHPIGLRPIGRPIGISTHGIGPVGPAHGGLVNGLPVQERTQH